jgi:hypothetical protein
MASIDICYAVGAYNSVAEKKRLHIVTAASNGWMMADFYVYYRNTFFDR